MISLRGMTWDHERGYGPLVAVTKQFQIQHPEVRIEWDRRSLKDFGDYPVDKLASRYDLIMIDHPHVGDVAAKGVLVRLNDPLPTDYLADQQRNSVGASHASYQWKGGQWALAADAAAQVAAFRQDLLEGASLPTTWSAVRELAAGLPPGRYIGWPLCPTDSICSFLTLCAQFGGEHYFDVASGIDRAVGEEAAALMLELLPKLHPQSLVANPIQMLNAMSQHHEIAYVPLLFGYSNYSRNGTSGQRIDFGNIPSSDGKPHGSILGGVGIAVSSFSAHIETAVQFAAFAASGEIQRTTYYRGGGQPGHLSAWTDPEINRDSNQFFANTLETLTLSHVRPRFEKFPAFQEQGGVVLHEVFSRAKRGDKITATEVVRALNETYRQQRG